MHINAKLRTKGKEILAKFLPDSERLRYLCYLPQIEIWKNVYKEEYPIFNTKHELYDYVKSSFQIKEAIDYLEFGVFKGDSIKYWLKMNKHAGSRFYGFDTFTGLPDDWVNFTGVMAKKTFDANGEIPNIDDKRVFFLKGLFQYTLSDFLKNYKPKNRLVIHNDSDLYSSTLYVLTKCNDIISPGTIIIFDEFSSVLNEFRALQDYCSAYIRKYEVIGATDTYYAQVAIRMVL